MAVLERDAATPVGQANQPDVLGRRMGLVRRLVEHLRTHDVGGLSAEIAYRFVLAVMPFGIFVAALSAFVAQAVGIDNPADELVSALGDNLPGPIADAIRPELERVVGSTRVDLLSLGAVAALWAATGATRAVAKGLNRAYGLRESRSLVLRYLTALVLTLLASVGLIAAFVTIVGGAALTEQLARGLGLGDEARAVLDLLRWPAVAVVVTAGVALLYRYGPNVVVPWRWIVIGAIVFTIGWLVATALLALYVAGIADYGAVYGSLAGFVVLLIWFYVTALLLVTGAETTAALTLERSPGAVRLRREELAAEGVVREVGQKAKQAAKRVEHDAREAVDERDNDGAATA